MIHNMTGGGKPKHFAAISVTYPAGATVTCSNGSKTLAAEDSTGKWMFSLPSAGTWTVTATKDGNTKSVSVDITTEGQHESVAIFFTLVLFENGEAAAVTGGFSNVNANGLVGASAGTNSGAGASQASYSKNKVDFTGLTTLHFNVVESSQNGNGSRRIGLSSVADGNRNNYVAETYANYTGEFTIDISAISEPCAVLVYAEAVSYNGNYYSTSLWCDRIWAD